MIGLRRALGMSLLAVACSSVAPEAGPLPDPTTAHEAPIGPGAPQAGMLASGPGAPQAEGPMGAPGGVGPRDEPAAAGTDAAPEATTAAVPVAPVATAVSPVEVDPVDVVAERIRSLEADPAPERTTNDKHYIVSNERRLDLYRPEIDARGGVLLGVGSDQNYLMAAWAEAELLVVVDFDQQVVDLHSVHGALMAAAPTMEAFGRLWTEDGVADAHAALREAVSDGRRRRELVTLYDGARVTVDKRLRKLGKRYRELGVHSYLDTPQQYRYVADLHARGRVVAVRGDFTVDGVLRNVADVLREQELSVSILYLSNIEQYFTYRRPFKDNMLAIPLEDRSMVLRTLPGQPAGFQYILQRGGDFHAWMRARRVWSVYRLRGMAKGEHLVAGERFVVGAPPTPERG